MLEDNVKDPKVAITGGRPREEKRKPACFDEGSGSKRKPTQEIVNENLKPFSIWLIDSITHCFYHFEDVETIKFE